jgi:hypothetical protein
MTMLFPGLYASQPLGDNLPSSKEYEVKAALFYWFAQFVVWPADAFSHEDSPIVIGIVGSDPFGTIIDHAIVDKKINRRPLVVRRLGVEPAIRQCHMLFISSSESGRIEKVMELAKDLPVLTIGETDQFAKKGGMIHLVLLQNGSVGMEINNTAAKQAQLNISSRLLNLAKVVQ